MVRTRPKAATHSENHCDGPARTLVDICSSALVEHHMRSEDADDGAQDLHDNVAEGLGAT